MSILGSAPMSVTRLYSITSGLTAEDTVAYDSSYSTTTLAGNVQLVMDGGDMGGGPGGAPGGGGPGGGQ